jgi:hypothetical protein
MKLWRRSLLVVFLSTNALLRSAFAMLRESEPVEARSTSTGSTIRLKWERLTHVGFLVALVRMFLLVRLNGALVCGVVDRKEGGRISFAASFG